MLHRGLRRFGPCVDGSGHANPQKLNMNGTHIRGLAVGSMLNERTAVRGPRALDDIAVSELPLSDFAEPAPLFVRLRNHDDAFLAVDRHRRIQCGRTASHILEKLPRGRTLHERRLGRLPFRLSPADRQ